MTLVALDSNRSQMLFCYDVFFLQTVPIPSFCRHELLVRGKIAIVADCGITTSSAEHPRLSSPITLQYPGIRGRTQISQAAERLCIGKQLFNSWVIKHDLVQYDPRPCSASPTLVALMQIGASLLLEGIPPRDLLAIIIPLIACLSTVDLQVSHVHEIGSDPP